uniref:DNA mismatch repair protein S5 domain-containing protein n=2 Tax=Ciona intestinalis TaxID=7719 RepID=F6ZUK0_CIOIN
MHKLSSETSKLISSAQVATSVSNVVKELTENALDAGATSIQVKLVDFGLEKIEVRDNGCGIKAEEMKYAAQRHYTSKLRTDKDLLSLLTYGFRGEALSSACEVSDVCITTKTRYDAYSTAYTLDSKGSISLSRPSHLGQGTTVVISNIFKNLPVRKSYYANSKKRKEQLKLTEDMLIAYALANPSVHLSLSHNKTVIWQKPACKTLSEAVVNVLGSAVSQNLEEKKVQNCEKTVAIHAFVPKKVILRRTCDRCYVLINKRPIQEKQIDKTIKKMLGKGDSEKENNQSGWPTAILSITLPTDTVDVNVNPNKTQVMLTLKEEVLKLVENLL